MSDPLAISNERLSRIPADVRALMNQEPVRWELISEYTHVCADCQPNCSAVYRARMGKEFKRLNKVFQTYALSLMKERGWTLTAATETAKMRQAAAVRVSLEQRRLLEERRAESYAQRTLTIRQGRARPPNEETESERERALQDENDASGANGDYEYEGDIRAPITMGGGIVVIPHRYHL